MKIVALAGEPATGKTTVMWGVIARLAQTGRSRRPFKVGLITGYEYTVPPGTGIAPGKLYVLGRYDAGQTFAGTDRLSMAAPKEAVPFIHKLSQQPGARLLFEGDRLMCRPVLEALQSVGDPLRLVMLKAGREIKRQRHEQRGDDQPERFLKSRATKLDNLAADFKFLSTLNETPLQAENLITLILTELELS